MNLEDQDWEPPSEADMKLIAVRRERADKISKLMAGYLLKGYKMLGSVCDKCDTILVQDRQGTNICVACVELDSDTDKDNPAINESAAISMARELEIASAASSLSPTGANNVSAASASIQTSAITDAVAQESSGQTPRPASFSHSCVKEKEKHESKARVPCDNIPSCLSVSSIDVQSFTTSVVSDGKDEGLAKGPSVALKRRSEERRDSDSGFVSSQTQVEERKNPAGGDSLSLETESIHVSRLQDKIKWASVELSNTPSLEYSIHLCQLIKIASEAIVALRNARM